MSNKLILILACCLFMTSACNIVFKQNIQQGNAIEQDKLDQLKLGMTMNQVSFLMGTPAVRDPFHQQRWDYYYSFSIRGGEPITRLVTLKFENSILAEIKGVDFDDRDAVVSNKATQEPVIDDISTPSPAEALETEAVETEALEIEALEAEVLEAEALEAEAVITAIETPGSQIEEIMVETVETKTTAQLPEADVEATVESVEASVEVLDQNIPAVVAAPAVWIIQLGAFDSQQNAENLIGQLQNEGFEGSIINQETAHLETRYLVRTQSFETRVEAQKQLDMINSALQLDGFLVPPGN